MLNSTSAAFLALIALCTVFFRLRLRAADAAIRRGIWRLGAMGCAVWSLAMGIAGESFVMLCGVVLLSLLVLERYAVAN